MNKSIIIVSAISFLVLSGCASNKYAVTFDSTPQAATLICNGKSWGYTPKTLYYDEKVKQQYSLDLSGCSANWVSGARLNYGSVSINEFPNGVRQTLPRPRGEGYAQDAEFEVSVKSMQAQQRQANAAARQASAAEKANRNKTYQNFGSQGGNSVQCTKFGDLSGRIHTFSGSLCPFGYMQKF